MSDEQQFVQRVQQVDQEGRQRFGDDWGRFMDAIGRANAGNSQLSAALQHVIAQPNATDVIAAGGKEALITLATNGDDQANRTYSEMRANERREHRLSKGRGPGWA
jgi:hypothetical protein